MAACCGLGVGERTVDGKDCSAELPTGWKVSLMVDASRYRCSGSLLLDNGVFV
jgi:hypothetical protein